MLKNKNYALVLFSSLMILIFILIVGTTSLLFSSKKFDFTENHRYTISPQTLQIIENINHPINVTVYFSEGINQEYSSLALHAQNIFRKLEKYQALSNGKISVEIKDPEPYSDMEKEAQNNNIRSFPNTSGDANYYFGATFINEKGDKYTIPYFSVQRENYAEYDLSRIFAKLNNFKKANVGIMSFAADINDDWLFVKQIANDYDITYLNKATSDIPNGIDVLLVFNPQKLSSLTSYALDQYIMRGGKLILLVDPMSEVGIKTNPGSNFYKSGIEPLLNNLGLEFDYDTVIGDQLLSQKQKKQSQGGSNFVLDFDLSNKNINQKSALTKNLHKLSFRSPGALSLNEKQNVEYTPLFFTSKQGGSIYAPLARFSNQETITNNFKDENKSFVLGYFVEGWFESRYEKNILEGTKFELEMLPFIIGSIEKAKIMVVADSDFLVDSMWNETTYFDFAGATDLLPSANNSDFILQAIDYMSGNQDVVGLSPTYLYNTNHSLGQQIYQQIFPKFEKQYHFLEQRLIKEQNELDAYNADIKAQKVSFSIRNLKQLEIFNRKIQNTKAELKRLDYAIKLAQQEKETQLIALNLLYIPFIFIGFIFVLMKLYRRHSRKKIQRLFNEQQNN